MTDKSVEQSGDEDGSSIQTEKPHSCEASCSVTDEAPNQVKVLIVEDSPIVRERLAGLVAELPNVAIVGQAGDGYQAQALFREHRPDAVVLDIQVPGMNGMDLLSLFKREHPPCMIMMLTTYAFKEVRQRCVALGADYFFDKTLEFERVTEVLGKFQPRRGLKDRSPD